MSVKRVPAEDDLFSIIPLSLSTFFFDLHSVHRCAAADYSESFKF